MTSALPVVALAIGLAILVWSADKFIDAAAALAHHFGLPALFIGVVIVGFGTSAPEMTVSVLAAMDGSPDLALGNALGSNIANVCLILGITLLMYRLDVHSSIVRKEIPILLITSAELIPLLIDGEMTRLEGIGLLSVFAAIMAWTAWQAQQNRTDPLATEADALATDAEEHMPTQKAWLWLLLGLGMLIGGSRLMVWGAVQIATAMGVSELVIGLTIVAVGTSLPELAACISAARKGQHELALGNVLGSNLFNLLGVIGLATVVQPYSVDPMVLPRDMAWIMGTTALLWWLSRARSQELGVLGRGAGVLFTTLYGAYTVHLFMTSGTA